MSKYKKQDEELKKADEWSRNLATHLYHMGASRIKEEISIFETSDIFRLTLERIRKTVFVECKCGHTEEISSSVSIELYVCNKCERRGLWKIVK